MYILVDIIVVLIILGSVYRGYKKGIVDIGFKLVAFIASLLIAMILYTPITNLVINNTQIDERIEEAIINNKISKEKDDEEQEKTNIKNASKDIVESVQNSMLETTAKPIAKNVVRFGVMVLLFLSSRIIFTIVRKFTNFVAKIPVIKQLNKIAGVLYGLFIGLLVVYVALTIANFVATISNSTSISQTIDNTFITKFLFNVWNF